MTLPSVSVVIPTYNRAAWLPETVASVLQQTHPPVEVIIVDDGSQDDTEAVCARFPAPVRYVRQENAGVSAARNRGIREANGEWIAFVDSDDAWEPTKSEVQLAGLARTPGAQWCVSGCTVVGTDGSSVQGAQSFQRVFEALSSAESDPEDYFARWLTGGEMEVCRQSHRYFFGDFFELLFHGNVVLPSSALVQREMFDKVGDFDESFRVAEDTEFFHRLSAEGSGLLIMSPLVKYRVTQAGSLTNPANASLSISNALLSLDRAAALRSPLTRSERDAHQQGRRRLLSRLAYTELSLLNSSAARAAQAAAWRTGAARTPRSLAIYAVSLLPVPVLRGLHRVKRGLAAARG